MDRKLAAIFAADVVGYSALMERDEQGTFVRLRALRTEIFEPEVEKHHGRVFKLMGDGLLAEFGSVVEAVECAVALQTAIAERNNTVPASDRIEFRIGINLGDIIIEGADRHGEGVNIAARLQQLAEPGGISVSQTVVDHLGNKLPVSIEPTGEHQVKNIQKPVKTYRVRLGTSHAMPAAHGSGAGPRRFRGAVAAGILLLLLIFGALAWLKPWSPVAQPAAVATPSATEPGSSLVVLPFESLSDDKDQGYLAEGITAELTTALARIPGLFVISRKSAVAYRDKALGPAQVAKELGVRYILEGSIRRAGNDMRITAQLVDATTAGYMWAERFEGTWEDVFELEDQVISKVASALKLRLVEASHIAEKPGGTTNPAAYNLYLQGYELNYALYPAEAAGYYRQALAIDPNFGLAWAELAWVYWLSLGIDTAQKALGFNSYEETAAEFDNLTKQAAEHPSSSYYQLIAGMLIHQRKSDEAILAAERAIALDPSDSWAYDQMARALAYNGRAADAKAYLDATWRVDPQPNALRYLLAGLVAFAQGQFGIAIDSLGKANPQEFNKFSKLQHSFLLAAAHAHLGHTAETAALKAELEAIPRANGLGAREDLPFEQAGDMERLLDGLYKAGVPDLPFGYRWDSPDRLTAEEIASLVIGHELRGRQIGTNLPYSRSVAADGTAKISIGQWSRSGVSRVEGDFLCSTWEPVIDTTCTVIFRNPHGTRDMQNEYVLLTAEQLAVEFSVVK